MLPLLGQEKFYRVSVGSVRIHHIDSKLINSPFQKCATDGTYAKDELKDVSQNVSWLCH